MWPLKPAKPVVDQDSEIWLNDMFDWCLTYLDADLFQHHSQLVLPNDQFFPGRVSSEQEFANNVFHHVARYSYMEHWGLTPAQVGGPQHIQIMLPNNQARSQQEMTPVGQIPVPFNPRQVKYPEAMISTTAQQFSQLLINYVNQPIPGTQATYTWAAEVVGVFLGFGIMFANTAYEFRGGCGCSYDPNKNRPARLAQPETLHALAMFCFFKGIKAKEVTPHLKPHLRPMLKQSLKYLEQNKKK